MIGLALQLHLGIARRGCTIWQARFNTKSGIPPSLVLDFTGAPGGQYFANGDNTLSFGDIVTYTGTSFVQHRDSDGLVKYAPHNLLERSEEFDNAYWSQSSPVDITANAIIGPDGNLTADKIISNTTSSASIFTQEASTTTQNGLVRYGWYAKLGEVRWIRIFDNLISDGISRTWFDLQAGVVGTVDSNHTATMTDVGNGWYLCAVEIVGNGVGDGIGIGIGDADNATTYNATSGEGTYIAQAQFNRLPMAAARNTYAPVYVPTTSAVVHQAAFWYDVNGAALGIRPEESRQNRCTWSDDWTKSVYNTVTNMTVAFDQTGADGVSNSASSLLATSGNGLITQAITASTANRVYSVWVKRLVGTGDILVTQDNFVATVDVKALINSSTFTQVGTVRANLANPIVGIKIVTSGDKVAVQYSQSEIVVVVGSSASSPISTTSSNATRNIVKFDVATADFAYNNEGANSFIISLGDFNGGDLTFPIQISDGTIINQVKIKKVVSSNDTNLTVDDNLGPQYNETVTGGLDGTPVKIGIAFELNNVNNFVDGAADIADSAAVMPSVNTIAIGRRGTSDDRHLDGFVEYLVFYGVRIPDADGVAGTAA